MASDGQTIPCSTLCPAHVNIPGYIALIKEGDFEGAVNLIRDRNPFPTACAMICEHPCEKKCRRTMIDQPVNIKGLKRYAVDQVRADQAKIPKPNVKTGKKIAIIGAGPSGLSAAWFQSLMGHEAVVFDEHEKPGGMLRYGIPEYRLPKERLDEDIRAILKTGNIELRCGTKIGRDLSFEKLREEYDAVYLGLGAQIGNRLPIENADAENVIPAADFLQAVTAGNPMDLAGKKVALIGGGNVAMDAARTAVRLHARSVHVLAKYKPSSELPDAEYPFILTTGRILYHYNAAAMTMRSPGMTDISGEGFIEINENDAKRLGISDNERVLVKSRRGEITAAAKIGSKVSEGETWMPFHFPDSPVNRITNPALDEFARIPEYKVCAVAVEKIL